MQIIALIPCVKEKLEKRCRAENLYISPFFKQNLAYAKSIGADKIFILSGKYGLLPLDREVEPYDLNLHDVSELDLIAWSTNVLKQLRMQADFRKDLFVILADEVYRKFLVPELNNVEIRYGPSQT